MSSNGKVRPIVIEKPGLPVSALLVDPLQGELDDCGKPDCNPCVSGTTRHLSCRRSGVGGLVYNCFCVTCKSKGRGEEDNQDKPLLSYYHGRTARCLYTRQGEHFHGLEVKKEDNAMWKHEELYHPNEECSFQFEAEKFFNDAMSHQIYEGVCINKSTSTPGYLMNSRSEYEQGGVARVVVAHGL